MPEIARVLLRKSVGSLSSGLDRCAVCRRIPLGGELLHVLESGRIICQLCLQDLPEAEATTVSSQQVRVSERPLRVAPRAA